jgi:hydroxycarboxylate dehydrogenase B
LLGQEYHVKIEADVLRDFVGEIFVGAGCSTEEGARIAKYLVNANLAGHDSHGVVRVPRYVTSKLEGTVKGDVKVDLVVDTPVIAVVDGKYGYGQTVTPQAVQIGIDKAKKNGLAAVALRNAGHIGRIGDWAEMAGEAGLVSIHFVNVPGSVLVAPYGGVDRATGKRWCCSTSQPPSSPKARCWSRAKAARSCPTTR